MAEGAIPAPTSFDESYEVRRLERRTPTIAELELHPLGDSLDYLPGTYVLLEDDRYEVPPRSYSVANAPRPDGVISLLVTRVPDGETSRWVHERLRVGDTVRISGPYGTFVDHPGSARPALLLAAGSGLAPIRALLEAELDTGTRRSLTLIFSARTEADVIDRPRFEDWQRTQPRFRFVRTLTRGAGPPPRGRIPALLGTLFADLSEHDLFIAGAPGFVMACTAAAHALGASRERIRSEVFFVEPQPWTREPIHQATDRQERS
jgi:CDP-4-dehydro-6-deoxyglucose reductase, E3